MRGGVDLLELADRDLRIELRRLDRSVAEHLSRPSIASVRRESEVLPTLSNGDGAGRRARKSRGHPTTGASGRSA